MMMCRSKFTAQFVEGGIDISAAVNHAAHEWELAHGLKGHLPLRCAMDQQFQSVLRKSLWHAVGMSSAWLAVWVYRIAGLLLMPVVASRLLSCGQRLLFAD